MQFPHLFSPFRLGSVTLPNRTVMAPMSTNLGTEEGAVTPRQVAFYRARAAGGTGMVIVEFCCVHAASGRSEHRQIKLFIAATNANSGKVRLFRTSEISADAILASACLPTMARPVEIEGEPYWDGGYAANPAVYPLFYECKSSDILMVLLTPLKHKGTPHTAQEIKDRMVELAFNSTFLREMRMFAHAREYVKQSLFNLGSFERRLAKVNFHVIEAQDMVRELKTETKLAANMRFFEMLRRLGRSRAQLWLQAHHDQIGKRSTVDLAELFY